MKKIISICLAAVMVSYVGISMLSAPLINANRYDILENDFTRQIQGVESFYDSEKQIFSWPGLPAGEDFETVVTTIGVEDEYLKMHQEQLFMSPNTSQYSLSRDNPRLACLGHLWASRFDMTQNDCCYLMALSTELTKAEVHLFFESFQTQYGTPQFFQDDSSSDTGALYAVWFQDAPFGRTILALRAYETEGGNPYNMVISVAAEVDGKTIESMFWNLTGAPYPSAMT